MLFEYLYPILKCTVYLDMHVDPGHFILYVRQNLSSNGTEQSPTLYTLRPHDIGGLVSGVLHARAGDSQLLHDTVQKTLDVSLGYLVRHASAPAGCQGHPGQHDAQHHYVCCVCHPGCRLHCRLRLEVEKVI